MPLIECVPNFSEGRDAAVVDAIVGAMLVVPGVYLLGREMDADHHRSVITLAGEAAAVAEAAVRGVGEAARRIDLRQHRGEHPRLGAADVVPFVPLEGATLAECVHWAEWAGAEIWRRFQVPVYLYAAAARRPERCALEAVRRGQFEGLREQVRHDPQKLPDFGPPAQAAALHPTAGATIVGARNFLIAYNVNLETADIEIARAIARTIRASGGGLPELKAMGVRLRQSGSHTGSGQGADRVQVSMNLTDFSVTSLATVWRAVNEEAAKRGVRVAESELVGLMPRAALEGAGVELLQLKGFDGGRVVENRLAAVMQPAVPVVEAPARRMQSRFQPVLAAFAAAAPGPGGGAAAALVAALAAALGAMAARLGGAAAEADALELMGRELAGAADEDSAACAAVLAARRLDWQTPEQRQAYAEAVRAATVHAAGVPLQLAARSVELSQRLAALRSTVPAAVASDLVTAAALAAAAVHAAIALVTVNLHALPITDADRQHLTAILAALPQPPLFP